MSSMLQSGSRQRLPGEPLGVAVVGCGLIGRRRVSAAAAHPGSRVRRLVDTDPAAMRGIAAADVAVATDWRAVLADPAVDIVVVSTPNTPAADIAVAALQAGRHVLMEKPMGRSLADAQRIHAAAVASGRILQVGFNHRHHPAIQRAAQLVRGGAIGRVVTLRARYGHGGRPGLEAEWRSNPEQSGGGELLDQGVHIADLFQWMAGMPSEVVGMVQTAVWPITPLEDNAYGLLRYEGGAVAQLHVSMTQWRNLFSLEVYGEAGAVIVDGLGGSYGTERLVRLERAFAGGPPAVQEEEFPGPDLSWAREWDAFLAAVARGGGDSADDGLAAMRIIDALYRSAASGAPVHL
jgi:predicted dehydrogenase